MPSTFHFKHATDFRVAVAGSVLIHITALVFLSPIAYQFQHPPPDTVLEVQLVPAQPLPSTSTEVEPPHPQSLPPSRPTHPRADPADTAIQRVERPVTPVPDVPSEPRPSSEPAPAIAPTPAAPSGELKSAPARETAVSSPPNFNAAYLNNPRPDYPRLARRNGEEGTVTLRVLVTRQGVPVRVETDKSSGSTLLDSAALDSVKHWRFVPARKGLEPVEEWVRVPIVFRLQD